MRREGEKDRGLFVATHTHTIYTHHHQPNQSVTTINIVGAVARKISNIQEKRE